MTSSSDTPLPPSVPSAPVDAADPTFRIRCSEDLLALVPVLLGFAPEQSVVLMTFGGAMPFHARVDLPVRRDEVDAVVGTLLEPVRRHHVDQVAVVLLTADRVAARRTWLALRAGFREAGVHVVEALRADGRRYHPYLRPERPEGVAYDLSGHPFLARAVLDGRVLRGSREEIARDLDPRPDDVARVEALLTRAGRGPRTDLAEEGAWVEQAVAGHAEAGTRPDDDTTARLALAVRHGVLRDAARAPMTGPRPTATLARGFVELWSDVVRRVPPGHAAAPAALLAWAAWHQGDGALAWTAVERATADQPDHPLAALVGSLLQTAVPPGTLPTEDWREGLAALRPDDVA